MGVTRYVNMAFVAVGLLAWHVLAQFIGWTFGILEVGWNEELLGHNFRVADLIGLILGAGIAIYLRREPRVSTFAMEVGNELSKVTWPSWSETKISTFVVIVTTVIISLILGAFDYLWASLSSLVYNV